MCNLCNYIHYSTVVFLLEYRHSPDEKILKKFSLFIWESVVREYFFLLYTL
jgi:hypothetical protein